jgi:cytochrome c553
MPQVAIIRVTIIASVRRAFMNNFAALLLCFCALAFAERVAHADGAPAWAYPLDPNFKLTPDDGNLRHVPDSTAAFSVAQTRDRFFAPDWHPDDHAAMPEIVALGRKPDVFACGFCHRADGPGGPENASLAGLPAAYIVQQMADMKNGSRKSAVPERAPPQLMIKVAKAASDEEVQASAAYFSALKPRTTIRVVETDTVPKTFVAGSFLADAKSGETETIGSRIIEVPEDFVQFENRDARSRFIAYVPVGSVQKGQALAAKGVGNPAAQCTTCHGPGLRGLGSVPALAGRSPSYFVRQLYDFKQGARAGAGSGLMKPIADALTVEDMLVLAAYVASLPPHASETQ